MELSDLDYPFEQDLIASLPLEDRAGARLLTLERSSGAVCHRSVRALPELLNRPCLFVVNDTRVLRARLYGKKSKTGGKVELLLVEPVGAIDGSCWLAMGKSKSGFAPGTKLEFVGDSRRRARQGGANASTRERGGPEVVNATVIETREDGLFVVRFGEEDVLSVLERVGSLPLPPYLGREEQGADEERYQTVFATQLGAVAAPTAGLHFTEMLMKQLTDAGHQFTSVTLHVGPGTFLPVRSTRLEDHPMHCERYVLSEGTVQAVRTAKAEGRPVVAVGTTVVRTLEAVAAETPDGCLRPKEGETDLMIYPPYAFRVVDALLTNFHLPKSTLLALVMAFAGEQHIRVAYQRAVEERYRFFSYGDAMLLHEGLVSQNGILP